MNNSNNIYKYKKHQQYQEHFNSNFTKNMKILHISKAAYDVSFQGHTLWTKKGTKDQQENANYH